MDVLNALRQKYPAIDEVLGFWKSNRDDGEAADRLGISVTAFEHFRQQIQKESGHIFRPKRPPGKSPRQAPSLPKLRFMGDRGTGPAALLPAPPEAVARVLRDAANVGLRSPDRINDLLAARGYRPLHPQHIREAIGIGKTVHYCQAELDILAPYAGIRPVLHDEINRRLREAGFPIRGALSIQRQLQALHKANKKPETAADITMAALNRGYSHPDSINALLIERGHKPLHPQSIRSLAGPRKKTNFCQAELDILSPFAGVTPVPYADIRVAFEEAGFQPRLDSVVYRRLSRLQNARSGTALSSAAEAQSLAAQTPAREESPLEWELC